MTKQKEVIRLLNNIALYMELKGENPFKIQAFRRAANTLEQLEKPVDEIEDLTSIKGIGKGTASVIEEYLETGKSTTLETLMDEVPKGLIPLLQIPGLGGKTIARLYKELQIENVDDLIKACEAGKVSALKGFGKKTEENILESIQSLSKRPSRYPIATVLPIAEWVENELTNLIGIEKFSRAGSLRRYRETIKDLDFIIASNQPEKVKEQLLNLPNIKKATAEGETKISCIFSFDQEIAVDFRIVTPEQYATALLHFTGSKDHNVRIRQLAKERKEKINEYGIEQTETGNVLTFSSEEEVYQHFGFPYISPELRMDGSEFDRVEELPTLVTLDDIKGDLHMHTDWSDGHHTLEEAVEACRKRGYEFMAITDHSQFLKVANGLSRDRLLKQVEQIRELNEKYQDITILAGTEMDILPDGSLDFDDEVLAQLDFVIASIHSGFNQEREKIMQRLENAMRNPYVKLIAHPTGRKIGIREGYAVDIDKLIQLAKETGTMLELNANPVRLDLKTEFLMKAQEAGVKIAINTDSHYLDRLEYMKIGVKRARKAWLRKETIVNTLTAKELIEFLAQPKKV